MFYTCISTKKTNILIIFSIVIIVLTYLLYCKYFKSNNKKEKFEEDKFKQDKLVFFHAKWCGHCVKFLPEIKRFNKKNIIPVDIYEDSDMTDDLRSEYKVNAYPMLYYKHVGKNTLTLYEGNRTCEGIEEFVNNMRNQI